MHTDDDSNKENLAIELDVLFSEAKIKDRIEDLGKEITNDYKDIEQPLILVAMLKGSLYFLADLGRAIDLNLTYDFIGIGTYASDKQTTAIVRTTKDIDLNIEDRDVLVVEEIIRTGLTTNYMIDYLKAFQPRSISLCTLLINPEQQLIDLPLKYSGFEIDYTRVIGYGMDYKEWGRNLPFIAKLDPGQIKTRGLKRFIAKEE